MKKEILPVAGVRKPDAPFNHVVKAGSVLYLTSQLSCNLATGDIIAGDIETQTRRALENVKYLLEEANSSLANVIKVTVYMRDVSQFKTMNEVYRKYFAGGTEPARVTVQAASPIDGVDIEIEVMALTNEGETE